MGKRTETTPVIGKILPSSKGSNCVFELTLSSRCLSDILQCCDDFDHGGQPNDDDLAPDTSVGSHAPDLVNIGRPVKFNRHGIREYGWIVESGSLIIEKWISEKTKLFES